MSHYNTDSIRCMFVGDLMFSGKVAAHIREQNCYAFPFERIRALLSEADLVLANLETVISRAKVPEKFVAEKIHHTEPPAAGALRDSHIHAVSLANNHIYDYGPEGVETTLQSLREAGIHHVGIGAGRDAARMPLVVQLHAAQIGVLAYCSASTVIRKTNRYQTAPIDPELLTEDISKLAGQVDHVVVVLHEGAGSYPSPQYQKWAHAAVDAGARLVIGHHPHVINGIEKYKDSVIAYGLGNFVADFTDPFYRQSMILDCRFSSNGSIEYQAVPVWINESFQPEPAQGKQAEAIAGRIRYLSQLLETGENDKIYFQEMSKSYWRMQYREVMRSIKAEGVKAIIRKASKVRLHHFELIFRKLFH